MNKEAIEKLKEIRQIADQISGWSLDASAQEALKILGLADEALTLLKQQPSASEFTMRFRAYLDGEYKAILLEPSKSMNRPEVQTTLKKQLLSEAKELCDCLDREVSIKNDLLAACKDARKAFAEGKTIVELMVIIDVAIASNET